MLSSIDRMRHAQIWDLLYEYADIREQLESIFESLCILHNSIETELEDISEDFDSLQESLNDTSRRLYRFRRAPDPPNSQETPFEDSADDSAQSVIPFLDDPDPEPPVLWGPDLAAQEAR